MDPWSRIDDANAEIIGLRAALRDIALNCEAAAAGAQTSRSWEAVGKLATDALAETE